jgi:ABC-type glycerol-3-phosphate transport system substrate-binding protein
MNGLRPFQILLLGFFAVLAVGALIMLSLYQAQKSQEDLLYGDRVEIWGTLSAEVFKRTFQDISKTDKPFGVVDYRQLDPRTFDEELLNAIAEGRSPDLIVLSSSALVTHRSKLIPIPYESLPLRDFKDTFVDGAEFFALSQGIYGIPFAADPLVMYWNRDLFATYGFSEAPRTWEAIVSEVVPKITERSVTREILQSGLSFGEFRNVENAKSILISLALQTGSKLVSAENTQYKVSLNESAQGGTGRPFESVLQFYTDFSNVNSPVYSWNRAVESAKSTFLGGDLALYFGRGSEQSDIAGKNPNLNFDVAQLPQGSGATIFRTEAEFYAFAIPKGGKNPQGAFAVARVLSGAGPAKALTEALSLSPVRRDLLAQGSENPFVQVVYASTLIARTWLDPQPQKSSEVFRIMVEDVVSNRSRVGEAVGDAVDRLELLY